MDPKFVNLDDAATQLNVSTDHLNSLREQGKLRAYRDGSSWKFRTEEIERMSSEGVPQLESEESGIDFDLDNLSLGEEMSIDSDDEKSVDSKGDDDELELVGSSPELAGLSDLELEDGNDAIDEPLQLDDDEDSAYSDIQLAGDDDDLDLELSTGSSADVSLNLDDQVPSEEAASSDLELELEGSSSDDPESILLSDAELGDASDRPPSTIIGRAELDDALDLELAGEDKPSSGSDPAMSDVQLADLEDLDGDAGATGDIPPVADATADFDDVEELEIDLEAESSRILTPEDVAAAQAAAGSQAQQKAPEASDLELELEDDFTLKGSDTGLSGLSELGGDDQGVSGSELNLEGSSSGGDAGLTGLSALELDDDGDDDDFVLGDGSDLTLSAGDSGINLSPADSGLSLDDAASDLTGGAIKSGIDFGEASGLLTDEPAGDFELTPMEEQAATDEDDDSSQVIALDAFEEQQEAEDLLGAEQQEGGFGQPAAAGFGQAAMVPQAETQFTGWQVTFLTLCLVLLSLCGMMVLDVVRSMWSWGEPYGVNSSLIESLSGFLFP